MGIVTGGLGGTHLITQGYGYVAVVIPPLVVGRRRRRPRLVYVDEKVAIELEGLGIIEPYTGEVALEPLNVSRSERINVLLSSLGIQVDEKILMLLDDLSVMARYTGKIPLESLKVARGVTLGLSTEDLRLLRPMQKTFVLSGLNIASKLKEYIELRIPDVFALSMKEYIEYLELLDLLDELNGD